MKVIQNPDKEYAKDIKKRLKENNGYCPCQLVKDASTKCQCASFREQIANNEPGACHCGLWIAVEE